MKISLNLKLGFVCLIPSFAFLIMAIIRLKDDSEIMLNAKQTIEHVDFIQSISELIHETQKERYITVAFISGTKTEAELTEQHKKVDQKLEIFKSKHEKSHAYDEFLKESKENISSMTSSRNSILKKEVQKPFVIKQYTKTIAGLIDVETSSSSMSRVVGVPLSIRSISTLETVKENIGRLRANVFDALASKIAIDDEHFSLIVDLKGGVDTNINSSFLSLSQNSKTQIADLMNSPSWKIFHEIVETVLKKSQSGSFEKDPKEFLTSVTTVMDQYAPIINQEITLLLEKVEGVHQSSQKNLLYLSIGALIIFLALLFMIFLSNKKIFLPIKRAIDNIAEVSSEVTHAAAGVSKVSHELSMSSQEQASSVEETSASLYEINQMISNNIASAESANTQSIEVSHLTQETAEWMEELKKAMSQILESNDRITALARIIEQIGEKTEVIDDIVFKTQLLSFNASVEAERAGEQGRGFAVVAQEVGNLARMSGIAATEISTIVKSSIKEAEKVSNENKSKVSLGEKLVMETSKRMTAVIHHIQTILDSSKSILVASKEQSSSVGQITQAVNAINKSTQQTSITAQECSDAGAQISEQSQKLMDLVNEMTAIFNGDESLIKVEETDEVS